MTTMAPTFETAISNSGLIAILRGVRPHEVVDIGKALADAGIGVIEVPLNSPEPLASIEKLATALGGDAVIGAGTVLDVESVAAIAQAGASLALSPDCNLDVVRTAKAAGLTAMPGVATATEALAALRAGADALKLFPAREIGAGVIGAWSTVLPRRAPIFAVGGVDEANFEPFLRAGAAGFGLGSSLYRPGATPAEVAAAAARAVAAWDYLTLEIAA